MLLAGMPAASAQTAGQGIFVLSPAINMLPPVAAVAEPAIAGSTLTFGWSALEPSAGVFAWGALDAGVAQAASAGKQVAISVQPGVFSPSWLYTAGAASFSIAWSYGWGFPACTMQPFPLPWDPVFLAQWQAFVQALGARYAGNPAVTIVKLTGIGSTTPEVLLPYSLPNKPLTTSCGQAVGPIAQWQAAGYTPNKVSAAWATVVGMFAAAFPTQSLPMQTGQWGLPPIDNYGRLTHAINGDTALPTLLMQHCEQRAGARCVVENDGLNAIWNFTVPSAAMPVAVAYQEAAPITGDANCQMNYFVKPCNNITEISAVMGRTTANHALFLEVYKGDAMNASFAPYYAQMATTQ